MYVHFSSAASLARPFVDQRVRTHGVLRIFDAETPEAYLTLDVEGYRIGLREVSMGQASRLLTQVVNAEGALRIEPGFGTVVQVDHLDQATTVVL